MIFPSGAYICELTFFSKKSPKYRTLIIQAKAHFDIQSNTSSDTSNIRNLEIILKLLRKEFGGFGL
jgi:hypothetical protein